MKKFETDGQRIKALRKNLVRRSTQKEFAHDVRISERLLRQIENENAEIPIDLLERMAKALGVSAEVIAFAIGTPRLVHGPTGMVADEPSKPPEEDGDVMLVPRFDATFATACDDTSRLFDAASGCAVVVSHIRTELTAETEAYVEELLGILESLSWSRRNPSVPLGGRDEVGLRRRIRELLVLLKGNDVWVYETWHHKRLPEGFEVERPDKFEVEVQSIVVFGPPGEYGEVTIHNVPVDNGRPFLLPRDPIF